MTDVASRVPVSTRVAAVVVAVVTVVGTLRTWSTTVTLDGRAEDHPAWTSGTWPATGALLAVAGVLVLVAAVSVRRGRRAASGVAVGAVLTVAGVVTLLVQRYQPVFGLSAVTYAIAEYDYTPPDPVLEALPDATGWVLAGGLGALVVVAVALPARTSRSGRRVVAGITVAGALLFVVGAAAFPWTFGSSTAAAVPLWRADSRTVTGAVLLLLAAVVLAVAIWWPLRATAVTAALLAAGGLGVLLTQRLPNPWADRTFGLSGYQPLEALEAPAAWRFQAATTLVLLGAVLVLLAAVLLARRRPPVPHPAAV